jgi:hypothetical protein
VFSEEFTAEEFEGTGDKESGDTTMVDVQKLLKAFLTNMSLRYTYFFRSCAHFWEHIMITSLE